MFIGTATVDIVSPQSLYGGVIDGQYSAILQSGAYNGPYTSVSIEQKGTIPANAESLEFKAFDPSQLLSVSFAGNSLMPVVLGSGKIGWGIAYTLYGIDIAPFEGECGLLEFTANPNGNLELDDIAFSTTAIPEPSTLALLFIGGIAVAVRRWRQAGL